MANYFVFSAIIKFLGASIRMAKRSKSGITSAERLKKITEDKALKTHLTLGKLVSQLERRGFGFLILLFALPSALPFSVIPGFSLIFSIPLIFFATQMILGGKSVWLPKFLANKELPHKTLCKIIYPTLPVLRTIEHLFKERWLFMTTQIMERFSGLLVLLLAIGVLLPIPLTNAWIAAIIVIFALGMIEDDGLVIAIAWIVGITSLILIPTFIWKIVNYIF